MSAREDKNAHQVRSEISAEVEAYKRSILAMKLDSVSSNATPALLAQAEAIIEQARDHQQLLDFARAIWPRLDTLPLGKQVRFTPDRNEPSQWFIVEVRA